MDDFDLKPSLRRRLAATILAVMGIVMAILQRSESSKWMMCANLLLAWELAFTPSPPLGTPLRQVYARARAGWRTPLTSKVVSLAGIACFVVAEYMMFHGR